MPKSNKTFWKAVNSLTHPASIIAIVLLLLNDHWLRWATPSWLTGKLGDFTWLIFAPFIAAMVFAWIVPRHVHKHENIVGFLSFAVIGLWFALAKTVPAVHLVTTTVWETIINWQGSLRMDASDLLILPALLIGWRIWQSAEEHPVTSRPVGSVVFALAIFATLASDGPLYYWSDSGIVTICQVDSLLMTTTESQPSAEYKTPDVGQPYADPDNPKSYIITPRTNVFRSEDGGLTWSQNIEENFVLPETNCSDVKSSSVSDPNDNSIQYRWKPGESIERSTDGGANWTLDYELIELQQDVRRYYNHYSNADSTLDGYDRQFILGPVSGLVDQQTGNLVLAMSWDGVLVRVEADDSWHWVSLDDDYGLANLQHFSQITTILFFELWLAGALAFLVVTTSTAYIRQNAIGRLRKELLAMGWLSWVVLTVFLLPDSKGNTSTLDMPYFKIGLVSLPLLVFLAMPLSIGAVWDIARNFRHYWKEIVLVALGNGLLLLLPFILWMQGTIPRYTTALVFAMLLTFSGLVSGYKYLRRTLPVLEKPDVETRNEVPTNPTS